MLCFAYFLQSIEENIARRSRDLEMFSAVFWKAIEDSNGKIWIVVAHGWGRFQEAKNLIETFNMHKNLGSGLWYKFTVTEQLANI